MAPSPGTRPLEGSSFQPVHRVHRFRDTVTARDQPESLTFSTDTALYRAKDGGRNQVVTAS